MLCKDPILMKKLALNSRKEALKLYDLDLVAQKYAKLLLNI